MAGIFPQLVEFIRQIICFGVGVVHLPVPHFTVKGIKLNSAWSIDYEWSVGTNKHWIKQKIMGHLLFLFVFSVQLRVNFQKKLLPTTGLEPRTSALRSDRYTDWATTTASCSKKKSNSERFFCFALVRPLK